MRMMAGINLKSIFRFSFASSCCLSPADMCKRNSGGCSPLLMAGKAAVSSMELDPGPAPDACL